MNNTLSFDYFCIVVLIRQVGREEGETPPIQLNQIQFAQGKKHVAFDAIL